MIRVLSIPETINKKQGSYWWRNWEDRAGGGTAPAKTNAALCSYIYEGKVFYLVTTDQRGIAGGKVIWEVVEATNQYLIDYILGIEEATDEE